MTNRLLTIYNLISSVKGVIDVGTDHGYIPVELAQSGYKGAIFASDINIGPLNSAKQNAALSGVDDKIEFLLSDGLKACDPTKIDTVIIAGMGGDLIVRILEAAPWCKSSDYNLILQPMTKQEVLRNWLIKNGFSFTDYLAPEKQRYYQILSAKYGNTSAPCSESERLVGKCKDISRYEFFDEYLDFHISVLCKELSGLQMSNNPDLGIVEKLEKLILQLSLMKEQKTNDK